MPSSSSTTKQSVQLSSTWREKICHWSYKVVDYFDLPREFVEISLNILDRYMIRMMMMTTNTAIDQGSCTYPTNNNNIVGGTMTLLLASVTTLYITIKVHGTTREQMKLRLDTLASLSRNQFQQEHILQMEQHILYMIGWQLHPPTCFTYLLYYLQLLPSSNDDSDHPHHNNNCYDYDTNDTCSFHSAATTASSSSSTTMRKELFELSIYMAELSVCDSYFVSIPKSIIALAALLNVMDTMPYSRLSQFTRTVFSQELEYYCEFNVSSNLIYEVRDKLQSMFDITPTSSSESITAAMATSFTCNNNHNPNKEFDTQFQSSPCSVKDTIVI